MKQLKPAFLVAAIWEIQRFMLLSVFLLAGEAAVDGRKTVSWLLFYGAGSLVIPAGLTLIMLDSKKYAGLLNLMRLGKLLQFFPGLLLLGTEVLRVRRAGFDNLSVLVVLGVAVFDLIFLIILLSYKLPDSRLENAGAADESKLS